MLIKIENFIIYLFSEFSKQELNAVSTDTLHMSLGKTEGNKTKTFCLPEILNTHI